MIVWLRPGASILVRVLPITKSCTAEPAFRTTKRTVAPFGTDRRESVYENSFAATLIVIGPAAGAASATATEMTVVPEPVCSPSPTARLEADDRDREDRARAAASCCAQSGRG